MIDLGELGGTLGTLLTELNKSDARSSRKCPWAVDLENMAMPSARRRSVSLTMTILPFYSFCEAYEHERVRATQ